MSTAAKLLKLKWELSNAESLREFKSWYTKKWKRDYPDLYEPRLFEKFNFKNMARRYIRRRRRRLTAKRAIALVSPIKAKRARYSKARSYKRKSKREMFSPATLTHPVGSSTSKNRTRTFNSTADGFQTRTLNIHELSVLSGSDNNRIDERQRDITNVRGWSIHAEIFNKSARPLYLHCAVVMPRGGSLITSSGWFRGEGQTRSVNADSGLSSLEWNNLGINSDEYVILKHKKYIITGGVDDADVQTFGKVNNNYKSNLRTLNFWVPFNRQLRYEDKSGTNCETKVFLVVWCDIMFSDAASLPIVNVLRWNCQETMYFKEPRN